MDKVWDYRAGFGKIGTISDLLEFASRTHGDIAAIKTKSNSKVKEVSYRQLEKDSRSVASFINSKGLKGKNIGIIGNLGHEWIASYFGIICSNNAAVPLDRELNDNDLYEYMVRADIAALFIDNEYADKAYALKQKLDDVSLFVAFEPLQGFENLQEYINVPGDMVSQKIQSSPEDMAMLVLTSGTTAMSKIVMLSNKNICDDTVCCVDFLGGSLSPRDCIVPVLPPHHMFGITASLLTPIYFGMSLCFGGGLKYITNNINFFKPVILVSVPIIVDRMYKRIWAEAKKIKQDKKLLKAIKVSNALRKVKIDLRQILFKSIHEKFGGRMGIIVCGGAFLEPELVKKYNEIGISLRNGYGITECSPVLACNLAKRVKVDSVGRVADKKYCQVKIIDGEILVSGSIVTKGYYKDQEATDKAFKDGYFITGDLGNIDNDGYLYITGRKKNLIILADGNNISPEELEIPIEKLPLVKSVMIKDSDKSQNVIITAEIYPDYEYAKEAGITDIKADLDRSIREINFKMPPHKRVQKIEVVDDDFEKTSLGKIKRYLVK